MIGKWIEPDLEGTCRGVYKALGHFLGGIDNNLEKPAKAADVPGGIRNVHLPNTSIGALPLR
jgi:hypothetical protein